MIKSIAEFLNRFFHGSGLESKESEMALKMGEIQITRMNGRMILISMWDGVRTYAVPADESTLPLIFEEESGRYYIVRSILSGEDKDGKVLALVRDISNGAIVQRLIYKRLLTKG